jgi:hypothetical protein
VLFTLPDLFFERFFEVLDVDFECDSAPAKRIGDLDDFEMVNAEQIWDGVDDALSHVFDDVIHVLVFGVGQRFDEYFGVFGVFVAKEGDFSENFVYFLFGKLEVLIEHLLEFDSALLDQFSLVIPHAVL